MEKLLIALATTLAACAVFTASTASAHPTNWNWTQAQCKYALLIPEVDLYPRTRSIGIPSYPSRTNRHIHIVSAACVGMGGFFRHGHWWYKHFQTHFKSARGVWRCGIFHVTGRDDWVVTNVRLARHCPGFYGSG